MKITEIIESTLYVDDLTESAAFYERRLVNLTEMIWYA